MWIVIGLDIRTNAYFYHGPFADEEAARAYWGHHFSGHRNYAGVPSNWNFSPLPSQPEKSPHP